MNSAQVGTLTDLERCYGPERLRECIEWAANSGIEARRAIQAVKSALPGWVSGGFEAAG